MRRNGTGRRSVRTQSQMKEESTIYTRLLSVGEVESVIAGLPDLFCGLAGDCILTAEYGTECRIHNDLQYVSMQVGK